MDQNVVGIDLSSKSKPIPGTFPREKSSYSGIMYSGIDENYSVDEILDTLRKKRQPDKLKQSLENSEKDSEIDVDRSQSDSCSPRDSSDVGTSTENFKSRQKTHNLSISEMKDLVDRRVSDARFDVVENKIDRVLTSLKGENKIDEQGHLFQLMLARIRDLEEKLDKKTTRLRRANLPNDLSEQEPPFHPYSNYVVEKATQTPSEDHECEGVYVLVSKKNNQQVSQLRRRHVTYLSPEDPYKPRETAYYYDYINGKTKPAVKKVKRSVGYPEYVYEESHQKTKPSWNRVVRKTIAFLPPIPDPYSKRRPRNLDD